MKKKTRYRKLRNLVLFCVWEDARVWAHWNYFSDMYLSSLGPESCVFTFWVSSELTVGTGCSPAAAVWLLLDGNSFLPKFPQGSPTHYPLWLQLLMTVTFLFTDMAGNIQFLKFKNMGMLWYLELLEPHSLLLAFIVILLLAKGLTS